MTESELEVSGFATMGLDPRLMKALEYKDPTPIQREAIPILLEGKDLVGLAGTGTGKTAAFALPILHRLRANPSNKPGLAAIILTPTRELAIQVAKAVKTYGKPLHTEVLAVYGGTGYTEQTRSIRRGVDIIVATPGRALDLIRQRKLSLESITTVVLDEADEMLNMGFAEDMDAILSETPKDRQTMLFSATMPPKIEEIAKRHLRNPVRIKVARDLPVEAKVRQTAYIVTRENKAKALCRILDIERPTSAIIFCRTRSDADNLFEVLSNRGFKPLALHGGLTQNQRDQVMGRFRTGSADLLVATDIAARGLDISHLTHVINYDLPTDPDQYIHRIGRVGRAGRAGVAITLASWREKSSLAQIERTTKQQITMAQIPTTQDLKSSRIEQTRQQIRDALSQSKPLAGLDEMIGELAKEFSLNDIAKAALSLIHQSVRPDDEFEFGSGTESRDPKRKNARAGSDFPSERTEKKFASDRTKKSYEDESPRDRKGSKNRNKTKLFFGIGRDSGITPRDLIRAITNEAGISGQEIGTIDLTDRFALVEVPNTQAQEIVEAMQGLRIRGQKVKVRPDRQTNPGHEERRVPVGNTTAGSDSGESLI